jgi:hypothetical protein
MKVLLSNKWAHFLCSQPETGMGFWTGNVTLVDGRTFDDVIIDSGYITKIRGRADIPFQADEVEKIQITGKRWDWKE